jgi:MoxR-like ATPase
MPPKRAIGPEADSDRSGAEPILGFVIATAPSGFLSVGQASAKRMARRATIEGRSGRTLLVHGPAGAGKGAFVDDLLALSFCSADDRAARPCNACRGCRDARARSHPDLVIGSPELWREQRSVGETIVAAARRWLLEAAGAPVIADRRIVLVEHADRASEQIQNALLKTLEEPSDRHGFILVADDVTRLLPTVRSRCQPLRIGPVPHDELVAHLMDRRRLPADQASTLARIAHGLTGAAIGYADRTELIDWRRRTQSSLLAQLGHGPADRFEAVRDLLDDTIPVEPAGPARDGGDDPAEGGGRAPASVQRGAAMRIVEAWIDLTRDLLVTSVGRADLAPSGELAPDVASIGPGLDPGELIGMLRLLERIGDGLQENASPRLALETAMLAWPRSDR